MSDKAYAEQAMKLANLAANAIEEGAQYLEMIEDPELKRTTKEAFDRRLNT